MRPKLNQNVLNVMLDLQLIKLQPNVELLLLDVHNLPMLILQNVKFVMTINFHLMFQNFANAKVDSNLLKIKNNVEPLLLAVML